MFRFPYRPAWIEVPPTVSSKRTSLFARLAHLFRGQTPPPARSMDRAFRPLLSIRIHGPVGTRHVRSALLDTGSQDTLFPMAIAQPLGIPLGGERLSITWKGSRHWVEFHAVDLELSQGDARLRWRARVGFTAAPLTYSLLGLRGCLEYFDARFCGADKVAELETNKAYPGVSGGG